MPESPPAASGMAALQYMFDMRHTALGTLGFRPPLDGEDLRHKIAVVTGGTGGIGLASAKALAAAGATVHIVGRNTERGQLAAASSTVNNDSGGGRIIFHQMDLSSIAAARTLQHELNLGKAKVDLLVQNLACMPDEYDTTAEGHERTLATNLLSFHTLFHTLRPSMAPGGRVISVVSAGMHLHSLSVAELRKLDAPANKASFDPVFAYCLTHRARVLLTQRWARDHPNLFIASVHPGWVETEGLRSAKAMAGFYRLMRRTLRTAEKGADTIAWLASAGAPSKIQSGSYCWDRQMRRIDLRWSGTAVPESEVDELVAFLEHVSTSSSSSPRRRRSCSPPRAAKGAAPMPLV